ncbi:MAG: hypothetical protein R3F21_20455 [Myxococcota bacterium]
MKTAVILGSKPGARLPPGGTAYFANAAIGSYGDAIERFESVVNVVSAVVLRKCRDSEKQAHAELYAAKGEIIRAARPDRLVLVESSDHPGLGSELSGWLRDSGYASPIECLSPADRIAAQTRFSGLAHPLVTRALFDQPFAVVLRDALHVVQHRLRLAGGEAMGKYRPSTGIVALLLAIAEHGAQAEYMLVGIGLSQRHLHHFQGSILSGKVARRAVLEPHVAADAAILRALARRYVLRADDPELAAALAGARSAGGARGASAAPETAR